MEDQHQGDRESAKTEQFFPPKEKETEGQEIAEQWTSKGSCSRGVECTFEHDDQERRKRKKVTSDRERQVRRIVDGLLRNQRTATKPRRALQKQMIDPLVSTARKDSAQKTQTAITGIFRPACFKKTKQSRQHVSVRSSQKKMVDRPVVKDNRKEPKSKSRRRSRNRPKQKETLCRNQSWTPSVFLLSGTSSAKKLRKNRKVHWSDYDVKVVYLEEANPTRHVIQRGDTHQIPLASPE